MLAVLLLTFGAVNAALALTVETCTQGGADSLYAGVLTLVLYLAGAAALAAWPPPRWTAPALLPAAAVAVRHSLFAARFAWGYAVRGMSACYALEGGFTPDRAGEWMDGGEPLLAALWIALSLVFWIAFALALRRTLRKPGAG
jgi:hypothetical protein